MHIRNDDWFYARNTLARDGWESIVDSSTHGWKYTGVRVAELVAGKSVEFAAENLERIILPLSGSFEISYVLHDGTTASQSLIGRKDVFHGPTDTLYLPIRTSARISGNGRVAVAEAVAHEIFPVAYLPRESVAIEMRGAGNATRQIHNFGTPANLAASRIIACEVINPAGNWSSYPPHKHDENKPGVESVLEEIYYFEVAVDRNTVVHGDVDPIGYVRNYGSSAGDIDTLAEVRTGDIVLVPYGWHGPCVAPPGYDLYYLNVMAGPDPERTWLITDDPAHGWVRESWKNQEIDPRLPYTRD